MKKIYSSSVDKIWLMEVKKKWLHTIHTEEKVLT